MYKKIKALFISLFIIVTSFGSTSYAAPANPTSALTDKQQSTVLIAALTAQGDLDPLTSALNEGLDRGLTINEIKEILIQMYAYTGFPRSLNGIITFEKVVNARKLKGIKDEIGQEPNTVRTDKNKGLRKLT